MIYVVSFWGESHRAESLEDAHKIACEQQDSKSPEYSIKTYETEMEYILKDVPAEFAAYISKEAWDRGHSAGEDEVQSIAGEMAYDLRKVISEYTARIILEERRRQK